ncbi:hypothetical protein OS493_023510 [Desmophyllum pertusum]|uniref:Uncharacterized protein n=1 Tax=Desmophyllum pertusum TaxID=174260 RepID=A0A9W9ZM07_9CNID|nr:hypothetical protein OS493_023510 [Desmophyllum pertusum]
MPGLLVLFNLQRGRPTILLRAKVYIYFMRMAREPSEHCWCTESLHLSIAAGYSLL